MGVKLWINKGFIFLSLCYNGRQWRESTGLKLSTDRNQNKEVMKLAEVIRSKREVAIITQRNSLDNQGSKLTLYQYVEQYSDERGREAKIYKVLPYLEKYGGQNILVTAITSKWFESFQLKMSQDLAISQGTAERYCCTIRMCIKKAKRDGYLLVDPTESVKHIHIPESKKEALTAEEVRRLVECNFTRPQVKQELLDDIKRGFLFACCTGLRVSDITQLTWGNIDTEHNQIIKQMQKTKAYVYVPLNPQAIAISGPASEHDKDELIFPELSKTHTDTNRYIHMWAHDAGIQKSVTWHTARHTDATLLIDSGADLYTVQRLLGHTKIQTTMIYAKLSDKKKIEAVNNLPDFGIREAE